MSETSEQKAIDAACPGCTRGDWGADGTMIVTPPRAVQLDAIERMKAGQHVEPVTSRRIALCDPSAYVSESEAEANTRLMAAAKDLLAVAKAYDAWEANLILSDKAWDGGMAEFPRLTQELLDEFMQVQALRNAAVKKATAPKGT